MILFLINDIFSTGKMGKFFTPKGSPRVVTFFVLSSRTTHELQLLFSTPLLMQLAMMEMYSISCNSLYILVLEAQYKIDQHHLPILLIQKGSLELCSQSEQNLEPFVTNIITRCKLKSHIQIKITICIIRLLGWSPPVGLTANWAFDSRSDRERPSQDKAGGPLSRSPIKTGRGLAALYTRFTAALFPHRTLVAIRSARGWSDGMRH